MMRRILSVMLAVSLVFPWSRAFVVTAMAEELPPDTFVIASGDCGDDLTWELQENGTLIITGTGAMDVYSYTWDNSLNKEVTTAPWGEYLDHIERISLPYGLTSIGPCAFSGLNITEIAIPDSVVYIGWGAFYYTNLSGELVIPESVTSIDVAAFANTGISGELVIPDSITYIYAKAFKNTDITGLVLPDTLQGIELEAFNSCTNLTGTLVIPESVTEIGDYAFAYTGISSVSMPDPWPYLGEGVFRGCPNLTEDYSPKRGACGDNLTWELQSDGTLLISGTGEMRSYRTVLDESAGKDITAAPWGEYWESIERISLPEGLTSIGGCAFYGLNITEISIPDTVTHICWHSFATCVNLSGELLIPESVTNIDAYAFAYTGISSARIPSPWTHLAEGVFYGCPNLTEDNFRSCGDSLTWELQGEGTLVITGTGKMWSFGHTWDESAHKWVTSAPWGQYWESIDSISLPEGLKSIGDLAFEGMNITEITIPSTVTYIGIAAFYGCVDLSGELVIPESVTRIRDYAFAHTGISSVDMPEPRPELGQGVFRGCSDLTENYAPKSGICGDNLTWELQEDGTLLFSGTGEMFSYTFDWNERENKGITAASWGDHWQSIERIVLPDGLTSIGDCAFTGLNITEIAIPNTVSFIGNYAFNECEDLCGTLVIPRSVTSIGSCAFGITGITKVYLPEPRPTLGEEAFPKGVTYAVLGAAVITADAILYLEPARNEKQNGSIEEGTEVVVVATTGVFSQLSDGSWIESKYVYEFSTPYPATADKLGQGTTVAKISYYEYPSENSTKLGEISAGVVRNLYAQSGNWYQAYVGGQYVWMRADGFNFTKANSSVKITMGIITADTDMYVGPGREFVTCGTIPEGREVNVYEIRDGWYKIYSGGKYVWVDGNYLYDKATGDPAIADKIGQGTTTKKVTIYSLPSEESKALGTIGADKIRNLYAQSGNWYQIYATINGVSQFCWVRCDGFNYTKANTNASYATVVIAETTDTYYGHGTEYETAVRLNAGTKVNVYEQWEDWYLVYRSGKYLWIQADKVKDFMLK